MKQYWKNLKAYPIQHSSHFVVGFTAGRLAMEKYGDAALILVMLVIARQLVEYHKIGDTPHMDLAYHILGVVVGVYCQRIFQFFGGGIFG